MDTVILAVDKREEAKRTVQNKIETLSVDELVIYFTDLVVGGKQLQLTLDNARKENRAISGAVENFIKEHYENPSKITQENLDDLAEDTGVKLTKEITVTFNIRYTGEFTVPLSFDKDDITEEDLRYSAEFTGSIDDLEVESEEAVLEDYEVEED